MQNKLPPHRTNVIALDSDGAITNFLASVPRAWKAAYGRDLLVAREGHYTASGTFALDLSTRAQKNAYHSALDEEFWGNMEALPGAQQACHLLVAKGWRLVCVTSMPERYESARQRNFAQLGLPIERTIAAPWKQGHLNPKLAVLKELQPLLFVDDLLSYFQGVPRSVHCAWLESRQPDSPNLALLAQGFARQDSAHASLLEFAQRMPAFAAPGS